MFDFRREPTQTASYPAPSPPTPPSTTDSPTPQPPLQTRPHANAISNPQNHLARPRTGSANAGPPGQAKETGDGTPANQDSITLGQLKTHTAGLKKEKTTLFDYRYDDTDTIMNELEEFYPYVEVPLLAESPARFKKVFKGEWTATSSTAQRQFVELQLEQLESPRSETRRSAQQTLLYLLQGCFGETTGPETQLHWVCTNARTVRSVDGVATLAIALKDAQRRYHLACEAAGENPSSSGPSVAAPGDQYDERSAELMDVLAMLYFVVEVFRSDETFGDELMAITPPLPVTLFQMVASMKDKLPKGFPVKKFLLLVWKVLLACLGGMKEVSLAKTLAREEAGLPMVDKDFTKSSPLDIASWRRDTSIKYPTFAPPPSISIPVVPNDKLAETPLPIPVRPNYHSTELPPPSPRAPNSTSTAIYIGTPAPSPPPSPKPKKQQFQTDPTRPFVFPYSRIPGSGGPTSLVPFAISEADRLYHQHAYVSLSLYQLWQTREECIKEERGLGKGGLIGFEPSQFDEEDEEESEWERAEWRFEMEEMECEEMGDKDGAKKAKQNKLSAKRLHRADLLYKSTLSSMQSCIVVLLKLLLATVTSPTTGAPNATYNGFTSPTAEHPPAENGSVPAAQAEAAPPLPSPEEIDINRHREITSKAVSAILILLLKWFKASHAIKGHYFAQLLFDSNCLLLVLKMFGLSDVVAVVQSKNECEDLNFFRYCYLNCSKTHPRPEDAILQPLKPANKATSEGEHETEVIFDYSWRNFFSTINFLKVLQKMTKHRTHRTFMMTQYKSSQILKRMLRVNQPMMQLQVLKLIKSQMPHCGRKWRQGVGNMKVITSIYLNCRPDLRDEWLSGTDQELEPEDSHPQEMALRALIQFYNKRHHSAHLSPPHSGESAHRRSNSVSAVTLDDPAIHHRGSVSAGESDVFPPRRTDFMPYNPDGMIEFWLHEYEDVLSEVFGETLTLGPGGEEAEEDGEPATVGPGDDAWKRLGEIMRGGRDEDEISDSESVVSVGELGEEARMDGVMGVSEAKEGHQGENTWEHMSPKTMLLLPRSPAERRRSSSSGSLGSPLRPVMSQNIGDLSSDPFEEVDEELDLRGPMPIEHGTADGWDRGGGAVDEVEYAFGE